VPVVAYPAFIGENGEVLNRDWWRRKLFHCRRKAVLSDKSQLERFKQAARELEADDDEARFNDKLGKLVKQKLKEKGDSDGK
jgi:hypothetical protein